MSQHPKEYLELSEESKLEQLRHAETLKQFETQRRARSIVVPTAVEEIKLKLRELGHPITLFGEDHADRRERLREVLARIELGLEEDKSLARAMETVSEAAAPAPETVPPAKQKEVFYSAGSDELTEFRRSLAQQSFAKAQQRLQRLQQVRGDDQLQGQEDLQALNLYEHCSELVLNMSQFGDERPLSAVRYSPDNTLLASGSFAPVIKLWDASMLAPKGCFRGHSDRITSLAWRERAGVDANASASAGGNAPVLLASSSGDGSCMLWDCRAAYENNDNNNDNDNGSADQEMDVEGGGSSSSSASHNNNNNNNVNVNGSLAPALQTFKGHSGVVSSCAFHPLRDVLATTSHDFSWRLWDIETGRELLLQDGHLKECSGIAFHPDGSLAMTTDSGGVALLWDLRSGHMIQGFQGHIKKISAVDFHPTNGFQVATSSLDNTVKIWDLRKRKCGYTLPAHSNVVTDMKYSRSGEVLLTSSFDGSLKLWAARDFRLLKTLSGHACKIMAVDFAPDERRIISAGYDRTLKLWAHRDEF